jgi:FMN-dependent NADH-azoreductase
MWTPVFDPAYEPSKAEEAAMNYAQKQIDELKKTDVLVITTPMWNFSVPAVLKSWMDQVLAPNLMFELTEEGPNPLHKIKSIVLLVSSGGVYKEDDERDALTAQVRAAFGFIGITDIRVAWADGQNPLFFNDAEVRRDMAFDAAEELAEELAEEAGE